MKHFGKSLKDIIEKVVKKKKMNRFQEQAMIAPPPQIRSADDSIRDNIIITLL